MTALIEHLTVILRYIDLFNSLLLLLAVMTYNQVQLFQVNDYANHYVETLKLLDTEHCTAKALQAGCS